MRRPVVMVGAGKPNWFEKFSHTAQGFYRTMVPFGELEREGEIYLKENIDLTVPDMSRIDILMLHVGSTESAVASAGRAKKYGIKVWLDFDDLLSPPGAIPLPNLAGLTFRKKPAQDAMVMCMALADVITVSTAHLREMLIKSFNDFLEPEKVVVVHNAMPDRLWANRKKYRPTNKEAKILWRGSLTHEGDIYRFRNGIKPFQNVSYQFYGHHPYLVNKAYDGHLENYTWTEWQPGLIEYFDELKKFDADYVLVPLEDNDFNKSKSNIAWLEGTWAGMCCIANNTMPEFSKVPTVAFDSPKSMEKTLQAISKGEDLRAEKYIESLAIIEGKYLLSHTNRKRMDIINNLS